MSEKIVKKKEPEKLEFGISMEGKPLPIWHYTFIPSGMRLATKKDLIRGRAVLYQVQLGPDAGDYYTDFVRASTIGPLLHMIAKGIPVYVKES